MKKLREYAIIYTIGSIIYSFIEILWRGFTHWTMAVTGGVCFVFLYISNIKLIKEKLWKKCLVGSVIITSIEFVVGCIVNKILNWKVWDYSNLKANLMGQICLLYSFIWFILCIPVVYFSYLLKNKLFRK